MKPGPLCLAMDRGPMAKRRRGAPAPKPRLIRKGTTAWLIIMHARCEMGRCNEAM